MIIINSSVLTSVLWIIILSPHGKCESTVNNNLSNICLDCVDVQQVNKCNVPFCKVHSQCKNKIDIQNVTMYETNDLKLVCHDDNSLTLKWQPNEKDYYFMDYSKETSNETLFTNLTLCPYQTIYKLVPNQKYEIQLYRFSLESKILLKSQKISGYTTKILAPKIPVENLNYSLELDNDTYIATVKWKPGRDLSCLYEIIWYGKKSQLGHYNQRRVSLKKQPNTEFNMTNLDFGKKYVFSIMSIDKDGEKESALKSINIIVPSCLDSYKNLSICSPETPKNLTIEYLRNETSISDANSSLSLKLSWEASKYQPNYYIAKLISKIDGTVDNFTAIICNISGVNNYAMFNNIKLGLYNQILVIAYSDGGASNPVYIQFPHQNNSNSSARIYQELSGNYIRSLWIWITLTSGLVLITVSFAFRSRNILFKYLNLKQRIDDTIVKYVVSHTLDLKWELNESKLTLNEVIGIGAFGVVQKGWYCIEPNKQSEVAVKMLKARPTEEQITQFYNEIEIIKSVPHHPHIVYLIGVITKDRPNNPLMLVEYCVRGDLQTFLRNVWLVLGDSFKHPQCLEAAVSSDNCTKFANKLYNIEKDASLRKEYVLQSKDLLSFARQIVVGMEFLSGLKMIHRDLATRNILLTEDYTIKISDFGLCRDIYINNMYQKVTGGKLPFRWMALESLTHQVYTTESDVWSFGIVLWEIVTLGGSPFPTIKTEDLIPLLKRNYRMENPINCSEELYNIMLRCWEARPCTRPSFTELREIFDKLLESEMQYISLEDATKLDLNYYENITNASIGFALSNRYIVQSNTSS